MIHFHLLLAHWTSLWYTQYLLLAHWLSLVYTTIYYWPIGCLYGTLLSSTGPLVLSMVHFHLLLAHWFSLWYTTIFYCPTSPPYGMLLSSGPVTPSYGTLPISADLLAVIMVHCLLHLAHLPSL